MSCCVCKCNLFHIFHRTKCVRVLCLSLLCVTSGEWPSSPSHVVEPLGLAAHPNNHSTFPVGGNERYSQSITAVAIIRARASQQRMRRHEHAPMTLCLFLGDVNFVRAGWRWFHDTNEETYVFNDDIHAQGSAHIGVPVPTRCCTMYISRVAGCHSSVVANLWLCINEALSFLPLCARYHCAARQMHTFKTDSCSPPNHKFLCGRMSFNVMPCCKW